MLSTRETGKRSKLFAQRWFASRLNKSVCKSAFGDGAVFPPPRRWPACSKYIDELIVCHVELRKQASPPERGGPRKERLCSIFRLSPLLGWEVLDGSLLFMRRSSHEPLAATAPTSHAVPLKQKL